MEDIKKFWPGWEMLEVLGQGGFGKVYKAKRESFGNITYSAIKIIHIPNNQSDIKEMKISGFTDEHITAYYEKTVYSLISEISLMENLKSAGNIVNIEDYYVFKNEKEFGWKIYIRMELLTNLYNYMNSSNFDKKSIVKMGIDICHALEYCHQQNIIHRDIKPDNIFVTKFNDFKLGDFGVSREVEMMNGTMSQKGTKSYMAPEMIQLSKYNHTVDLYALGLSMYELLNHGRMPFLPKYPEVFFSTDREEAMLKRMKGEEFPDIDDIGELNNIIKKACHYNPEMRYQSATEMKEALMNFNTDTMQDNIEINIRNNDDKTNIASNVGLFNTGDINEKDSGKTVGVFGTGLFDHIDVTEKKEEPCKDIQYQIIHNKKNAYMVFKDGYYDGNDVILTKEDKTTIELKKLFKKYLTSSNKKQILKKMISLDDCAQLHYLLGKEYISSSSKKYAKEEYKKAYEMDPTDGIINKAFALVCFEEKNYGKAYDVINYSIKQSQDNYSSSRNTLLYAYGTKAIICQKLKKYDEALGSLIKAYQFIDDYTFEIHKFPISCTISESSVLNFLHNNEDIQISKASYLMSLGTVYGIGNQFYKEIIEKELKKHKSFFKMMMHNTAFVNLLNKDKIFINKVTFSKNYYFGMVALYCLSNISNIDIPYLSYIELVDCYASYNNKEFIFEKGNQQIKIPINKEHGIPLQNIFNAIISKNNKVIKLIEKE